MRSDVARTNFGVDGSGVKVGVLSDSFNCLGGAANDVTSGDLSPVTVLQEISNCAGATDEGRAMLQIVHDVAPGASLHFASAHNGMASFATNIQTLAAAGAKVILDDVLYLSEPFFQDGILAQAVYNVVAGGAAYFSAAGNSGRQSYLSAFQPGKFFADGAKSSAPGAPHFFGGTAHNFKSGGSKDHFQKFTIPGQTTMIFILQWDSPFFSVSGSPGTQNDVDIYILNSAASQVLAGSVSNNIGNDAIEIIGLQNNGAAPLTLNLMIVNHSGENPGLIKYIYSFFGPAPTINEYNTNSSTIFGHANAASAEAVGAAAYFNTPAFGVSPPALNSYSSAGGTPILFDIAGNPVSDSRAAKPEIVAPDCANTTFFVSETDLEPDGFSNFCGTSAAVPHAGAVAALLLDQKPSLTPAQIYRTLEETAIDMGTPGFDNDSGFGLIQADAALLGNADFVRQQYLDFLDREADPEGFSFWLNQLNGGLPRSSLVEAIIDSAELLLKGKFIAQTYLGILTRDADYGGFRGWLGALLAGMSREQIVQAFLDSGEFQANFGSNLTNEQFVETMYNNILLRPSDPGGFSFWIGVLNNQQMTRPQVALSFLDSGEFQSLIASQSRVDISLLYFDMLRRNPDAGGFLAWVGALNAGVPLTSVIDAFLNSSEYQARF
jgi:subtilisin family serine protease